jgi:pimeloyl-ACP methyl ester carboxylesterase
MDTPQRFRIDIPQADLDELHERLARTCWPDQLPDIGWSHGVHRDYLAELVDYWATSYDWRAHEARLNAVPQFTVEIDGQSIHFLHARSDRPDAVPLLLLHGWPSTVADFLPLLPYLTTPETGPAFHVVAPSLPGFGFSGPTREPGWDATRIARAMAELMRRLGYERYLTQGGDFGSLLGPEIARIDPEHVLGVHTNALVTPSTIDWRSPDPLAGLTEDEKDVVWAASAMWQQRNGYATIQATRPQTLAYALTDSPAGLLAWDLEWFVDYDPTTSTQTPIDRDAILTDVTITWLTRTAGSSTRLYKEAGAAFAAQPNSGVPTAVATFPGDTAVRTLAERSHTIVRWSDYDRGGHFASLQAPDLLAADIQGFAAEVTAT